MPPTVIFSRGTIRASNDRYMLGGFIVVVGFIIILMIHEGGHLVAAKAFGIKVTKYFLGFGPTIWSFNYGETEYGIKAIPAGGYVKVIGMNPLEDVPFGEEHRTYRVRPFYQKSIVVMAGIATHFVLAFVLVYVANVGIGWPDYQSPSLTVANIVATTDGGDESPASFAGIKVGDRVVSINGVSVASWHELTSVLRDNANQFVLIGIQRETESIKLGVILGSRVDQETGKDIGFLGVSPVFSKIRQNPVVGVRDSMMTVLLFAEVSIVGLWGFITNFGDLLSAISGSDQILDEVRPVSIIGIAQYGSLSQKAGLSYTLELIAYISVFIGLLNTIPLYPFDGGHFAVAVYEKLTGRSADVRKLVPVGAVVFSIVVFLGILGIYFDITRPLNFG